MCIYFGTNHQLSIFPSCTIHLTTSFPACRTVLSHINPEYRDSIGDVCLNLILLDLDIRPCHGDMTPHFRFPQGTA